MIATVRLLALAGFAAAFVSHATAETPPTTRLAYATESSSQFDRRCYALYSIALDGSDVRLLSMQPRPIAGIDWGPTARKIAYADSWGPALSLWAVEPNDLDLDWFTTRDIWDDSYPSWSPDGRRIAMMSNRAGNDEIHIVEAAELDADRVDYAKTHDPTNITHTPVDERWPAWSPVGDVIAFVSDRSGTFQIHLTDPNGANVRQITHARDFPDGITRPPMAWSPDGRTLAFSARVGKRYDIYFQRLGDRSPRRLTNSAGHDWSPTYSPSGDRIAFASSRTPNVRQPGVAQIWMMHANGSAQEHVANGVGGTVTQVDWSPLLPASR
ncbi:hypothetical protein HN371_06400 [Candidatus Poribacteria bacterium]|nr:hypothetical protein [Candidatus Poribacteria bacterium]MBT5533403.1 hypothetical protein [Candidatus Poribacteria bacterium]MBT5715046.1 hypothetical protein [Candidatus Poribacteria bacterium]MBT7806761.1 hypothetical protein [Candidatus Poribacteria bacterium]